MRGAVFGLAPAGPVLEMIAPSLADVRPIGKITAMPLLDGLRVVLSKIHGYGVVTTRRFAAGELVCFGDGVLYKADAEFDDTYALILPAETAFGGVDEVVFWDLACQTRWFNHSCDPNSEVCSKWDAVQTTMRAWWIAKRDIEIGEEITYDYAFAAEVAEPCACGSARCRGLIVDDDPAELAKLPDHLRVRLRREFPNSTPAASYSV